MPDLKSALKGTQVLYVAAFLVLLAGLVWLFLVGETKGKLEKQVAAASRRIPGEVPSEVAFSILPLQERATDRLEKHKQRWIAQSNWESDTDGIALSTRVQSFLHEYRGRLEQEGIASNTPNLGFEDFTREVALLSSRSDFQSVAVTLDLLRDCLDVLIESRPISLRSVVRQSLAAHAFTGFSRAETGEGGGLGVVSLTLEFEGYTRSLRDFVNGVGVCSPEILLTRVKVGRSPRSEVDHTSKLFESSKPRAARANQRTTTGANPFAAFLQQEAHESSVNETQPLIGEVVSTFTLTLVRFHEL